MGATPLDLIVREPDAPPPGPSTRPIGSAVRAATFVLVVIAAHLGGCSPLRFPELTPDGSADAAVADAEEQDSEPADAIVDAAGDAGAAHGADAEPVDLGSPPDVDAGPAQPDAAPLTTVRVRRIGAPAVGVEVVFHAADGRVLSSTVTGPTGLVQSDLPSGAMVTVVERLPQGDIRTFFNTVIGIEPGDDLEFEVRGTRVGARALVWLPDSLPTAARYQVQFECDSEPAMSSSIGPIAVARDLDCQIATPAPRAFAVAEDTNRNPVAFSTLSSVPLSVTSTTEVTMPPWSQAFGQLAIRVAGLPLDLASVSGQYAQLSHGYELYYRHRQSLMPPFGQVADLTLPTIPDASDQSGVSLQWKTTSSPDVTYLLGETLAATATTVTFDLAGAAIPPLEFDSVDLSAPDRPRYSWTHRGSFADLGILMTSFQTPGARSGVWWIVFPPNLRTVRTPAIPAELRALLPANLNPAVMLMLLDLGTVPDYRAVRRHPPMFGRQTRYLPVDRGVMYSSF